MSKLELLLHNDDKKEKWQSHSVYNMALSNNQFGETIIGGYGATKEEAYNEFVENLDSFIKEITEFRESLDINKTVTVDAFGKPIKEE